MKPTTVATLALIACALLLTGCGVRFGTASEGTEFFKSLDVSGDMRVGRPLTALVTYTQNYPLPITIHCELRDSTQLIKVVGDATVDALENGSPKATPFPGSFSFDFTVDEPGTYRVECLTPLDEDNYLIEEISVRDAP